MIGEESGRRRANGFGRRADEAGSLNRPRTRRDAGRGRGRKRGRRRGGRRTSEVVAPGSRASPSRSRTTHRHLTRHLRRHHHFRCLGVHDNWALMLRTLLPRYANGIQKEIGIYSALNKSSQIWLTVPLGRPSSCFKIVRTTCIRTNTVGICNAMKFTCHSPNLPSTFTNFPHSQTHTTHNHAHT